MISSSATILLIIIDVTLPIGENFKWRFPNKTISLVIPFSIHSSPTHLLHIRVRNTSIETRVNDKQLNFIEKQLRQKQIPYKRVETNPVNVVIIVGPFPKLAHTSLNLTKPVILKSDLNQGRPTTDQGGCFFCYSTPYFHTFCFQNRITFVIVLKRVKSIKTQNSSPIIIVFETDVYKK